jgi:hypothetical protein
MAKKRTRPLPALRGAPTPEQQLVEQRPPGVVEHHKLTIEHATLGKPIEHPLEALHSVAVA